MDTSHSTPTFTQLCTCRRRHLRGTVDPNDIIPAPNKVVACLNKQCLEEVYDFIWHSACPSFVQIATLNDISSMKSFFPSYALRRIGLNFDNSTYLEFFGVAELRLHCSRQLTFTMALVRAEPAARVLYDGRLPTLTKLDIKFRSTRYAPWTDPWTRELDAATRRINYWLYFGSFPNLPTRSCLEPCQKKTTEIILALALEYVFHIDQITLEGDVKNSTAKAFDMALREKKQDPRCEPDWPITKVQLFDSGTPRQYVHRVPSKLACANICSAPICYCAVKCFPECSDIDYCTSRGLSPLKSIDSVLDCVRKYIFCREDD